MGDWIAALILAGPHSRSFQGVIFIPHNIGHVISLTYQTLVAHLIYIIFNRWRVYVLRQLEKWGEMKSPEQESYFCENIN